MIRLELVPEKRVGALEDRCPQEDKVRALWKIGLEP